MIESRTIYLYKENDKNFNDYLLCPVCKDCCTHLTKVEEYEEEEGRLCVKLYFWCEQDHDFCIDFHQHEGITFIGKLK